MFAKVFAQIFDSSIAENHKTRHVFEDLLKLADQTGDVDMTVDAISRRTNVPFEEVREAIKKLEEPDEQSRSKECEGRRIIRLDDHREWGWHIVNYLHYRGIMDEESRRSFFRDAKRRQREKAKLLAAGLPVPAVKSPRAAAPASVEIPAGLNTPEFQAAWKDWNEHLRQKKKPPTQKATELQLKRCEAWGPLDAVRNINNSIANNWQGLFPPGKLAFTETQKPKQVNSII